MRGKYAVARYRKNNGLVDLPFTMLVLLLLFIGLIMMFSASYANAYYYKNNSFYYITRQLVFAVIGLIAMYIASKIDYHWLEHFTWPLYIVTIALLMLVYTQRDLNGAYRWIIIGNLITFQPSELAKLSVIMLLAHIISNNQNKINSFKVVIPSLVLVGMIILLVVFEPHLSATALLVLIVCAMFFVGGINMKWITAGGGIVVLGVMALAFIPQLHSRAMERINIWRNPAADPRGDGFQTLQSLYAIASGGLLGSGVGNSRQKYLFLPEPQNDFVFAVVCEEIGFIGALFIMLLFILFMWRGFTIALKARDTYGTLLVAGLTAQVGFQALLNMAVVTNTIPNTGISLPFFSYGGTSLTMLLAQMGIILSVSRHSAVEKQ